MGIRPPKLPRPLSVVTGEPLDLLRQDCNGHRKLTGLTRDDPCGPDGKYWEAAEPRGFSMTSTDRRRLAAILGMLGSEFEGRRW